MFGCLHPSPTVQDYCRAAPHLLLFLLLHSSSCTHCESSNKNRENVKVCGLALPAPLFPYCSVLERYYPRHKYFLIHLILGSHYKAIIFSEAATKLSPRCFIHCKMELFNVDPTKSVLAALQVVVGVWFTGFLVATLQRDF